MKRWGHLTALLAVLFGGLILAVVTGCGGGNGGENGITLGGTPNEDSTKPSAVGGTIFTLADQAIDQAYNAEVTLSGVSDAGGAYSDQTHSLVRGGYQFANVPPGTYSVSATVTSQRNPSATLHAELTGIRARGNIPVLMANLLLGESSHLATFSGTVRQHGNPVKDAVVSVDVTAYTPDYFRDDVTAEQKVTEVSVILSTNTNASGRYTFTVPVSGNSYYVAAHSDASMVAQSDEYANLQPGATMTKDFDLDDAVKPQFATLYLDVVSSTLSAPTTKASTQALMTRLAVSRAMNASPSRVARLEKQVDAYRANRAVDTGGIVENDLYWSLASGDVGVRGFKVYRAATKNEPFLLIGTAQDPYLMYFFDNDPALKVNIPMYYAITSYAANKAESKPSAEIFVSPLPQVNTLGPAADATIPRLTAAVTWAQVPGAKSYLVTKFREDPTFNSIPVGSPQVHNASDTAESLSGLPAGTYWISVSAYNADLPQYATAAAYASYRKITLTE